jgi:hypothetical protein
MNVEQPNPGKNEAVPFSPAERRRLTVFGAPAELVLLPERAARPGKPGADRLLFCTDVVTRILAEETSWQDESIAITPNRYPFAAAQQIYWARRRTREHDAVFLASVFAAVDGCGGAGMINNIGAAASIPHAHAHVTSERLPFLGALRTLPLAADWFSPITSVSLVAADLPLCLIGVRGPAAARALAVATLQMCRMTAAVNMVMQDGTTWLYPRSAIETPAPHFPYALGAAEVWGRWCYSDRAAFTAATSATLERALTTAGCAALAV